MFSALPNSISSTDYLRHFISSSLSFILLKFVWTSLLLFLDSENKCSPLSRLIVSSMPYWVHLPGHWHFHFLFPVIVPQTSSSWKWKWRSLVTSDSFRPHGLYSPWNSPGQNTGVGNLSLLQGDLPNPGIKTRSPSLQADTLPAEPPGKPKNTGVGSLPLLQWIFPT